MRHFRTQDHLSSASETEGVDLASMTVPRFVDGRADGPPRAQAFKHLQMKIFRTPPWSDTGQAHGDTRDAIARDSFSPRSHGTAME
jgi:hypothetical protein